MGIAQDIIAVTESLAVADLYLHPLNPRTEAPEGEIVALAANIRALGLIQNLAGLRDETGRVGIVAGGRRLRALTLLADDPRFAFVPVKLAPDAETAAVWAAAENHARADLHPADEIREYASLRDRGVAEAAIAIAFGVTKAHVKRRLRLAGLPEPVLAALRANKIGLSEAAVSVVCDDTMRVTEVLARVSACPGQYSEDSIRRMLKQGAVRDTERRARFLGIPAYRAAGGRISSDLFGGEVYLDDVEILDGDYTPEQKTHAGVVLHVAHDGTLRASHAMVLPEDQRGAAEAGIIETARIAEDGDDAADAGEDDAPTGPPLSGALVRDLQAIRRGARQHAGLGAPDLLLALFAFHLAGEARSFSTQSFRVETMPTTETGYAPDARLLDAERPHGGADDPARAFKAFQKKGMDHIREVLTLELARLLDLPEYGDAALAGLFDKSAKVDVRAVWTPTAENFFKRAPGAYLDALWCEMTGADPESAEARAFMKAKKGEKAARLETLFDPATELGAEQKDRVAAWPPPEMF